MEALAKLVADITEFLVGGVLFLGSVALLAHVLFADELETLLKLTIPGSAAGALSMVALALMYAFGVVAEGLSRMLLEWRLTSLTVKEFKSDAEGVARTVAMSEQSKTEPVEPAPHATSDSGADGRDSPNGPVPPHREAESLIPFEPLTPRNKRIVVKKVAIKIREDWRTDATSYNESLGNTIEAQLKRLRIERTFVLSSFVCLVALCMAGNWPMSAAAGFMCALGAVLVDERFKRFLGSIVRAHTIMHNGRERYDSGVPTGASA